MKKNTALHRARTHLITCIHEQIYGKGDTLPGAATLSSAAGVSPSTMYAALRSLKRDGIIDGMPGRRFRVLTDQVCIQDQESSTEFATAAFTGKRTVTTRIYDEIHRRILNGTYLPGTMLPSYKELQSEFGVSFPPVKKALSRLLDDGLIQTHSRSSFSVTGLSSVQSHGAIVLILHIRRAHYPLDFPPLIEAFTRTVEQTCTRARVRLIPYYFIRQKNSYIVYNSLMQRDTLPTSSVYGYVFPAISVIPATTHILQWLGRSGKPSAFIDFRSDIRLPRECPLAHVRFFCATPGRRPGYDVGRYLLEHGHRHIAYITPWHNSGWSRNRFAGLYRAFKSAGHADNIHLFAFNNPPHMIDVYEHNACTAARYDLFVRKLRPWFERIPAYMQNSLHELLFDSIRKDVLPKAEMTRHMHTLFSQAARQKDITAWVCANDAVAVAAREYLLENQSAKKHHTGIIGFDDSPDAAYHRITSYNFNIPALARQSIWSVLRPHSAPRSSPQSPRHVQGMIIERDSVPSL
jgi:DNA-binding GntR family transcriptional regulator